MSAPLRIFLDINGNDEAFEDKKSLEDCDLGLRIGNSGYGDSLIIYKAPWAVRISTASVVGWMCE